MSNASERKDELILSALLANNTTHIILCYMKMINNNALFVGLIDTVSHRVYNGKLSFNAETEDGAIQPKIKIYNTSRTAMVFRREE